MPTLHGIGISPFVRKVVVALGEKGIEYEHIPVVPLGQTPEFYAISPLGKVPCYEDQGAEIPDSSIIIDYLERVQPTPPLYPTDPFERAQALFLEEYADTRLADTPVRSQYSSSLKSFGFSSAPSTPIRGRYTRPTAIFRLVLHREIAQNPARHADAGHSRNFDPS